MDWTKGEIQHAVFGATVIASRSEQDEIALNPPPIRYIPTLQPGEMPLMQGPGLDPPSQPELDGIPPVFAYESRAQMPLNIDPETGEIK